MFYCACTACAIHILPIIVHINTDLDMYVWSKNNAAHPLKCNPFVYRYNIWAFMYSLIISLPNVRSTWNNPKKCFQSIRSHTINDAHIVHRYICSSQQAKQKITHTQKVAKIALIVSNIKPTSNIKIRNIYCTPVHLYFEPTNKKKGFGICFPSSFLYSYFLPAIHLRCSRDAFNPSSFAT